MKKLAWFSYRFRRIATHFWVAALVLGGISSAAWNPSALATESGAGLDAPSEAFRRARALVRLRYCDAAVEALDTLPQPQPPAWERRAAILTAECLVELRRGGEAVERLGRISWWPAGLANRARYLQALGLAQVGRSAEAVEAASSVRSGEDVGVGEVEALLARAEAASAANEPAALQRAWQAVLDYPGRGAPKDRALAELARGAGRAGRLKEAKARWRTLAIKYPESPHAEAQEAQAALGELTEAERWDRARQLWDERLYVQAVAALEPFVGPTARGQEAHVLLGRLLSERLRERYPTALQHFDSAARGPDAELAASALFKLALVKGKLRDYAGALSGLRAYRKQYRSGADYQEAGYELGRHLMESGAFREAGDHFRDWSRSEPGLADRSKFLWFSALAYYRGGLHTLALPIYDTLARSRRTLVGDKALYWKGRSLEALGKRKEAHEVWSDVVRSYPFGYYAWLAEDRLRHTGGAVEASPDFSDVPLEPPYPTRALAALRGAALDKAQSVWDLAMIGRVADARALASRDPAVFAQRGGDSTASSIAAGWAPFLETVYLDRKGALSAHGEVRARTPTRQTASAWRAVFPLAYRDLAEAVAERERVPVFQLYAHMLQESRYGEHMVSGAKAYGLIQILPSTARLIAKDAGLRLQHADDLFDPGLNVRMGAWYLGALSKRFHGQLPLSIAAYNGGPRLLSFHLEQYPKLDMDVLIEALPTHQSRNYTRKVLEHMHRYAAIYSTPTEREALMKQAISWTVNYEQLDAPDY